MESDAERFVTLIGMNLIASIIPILTSIVGGIIALMMWRRFPRQSLLTLLAMVLLFVVTIAQTCVFAFQVSVGNSAELKQRLPTVQLLYQGVRFLNAGVYGLLLVAVFSNRRKDVPGLDD